MSFVGEPTAKAAAAGKAPWWENYFEAGSFCSARATGGVWGNGPGDAEAEATGSSIPGAS